jgi:hypothetical protein
MGIFDFLRKLARGGQSPKEENKGGEKVAISEIEQWAEGKIKEMKEKEKAAILIIQKKVDGLDGELKERINAAKSFDINSKKEEDRIKSAVEDGRKKYLEAVEDLLKNLKNLKNENLQKTIADTNRIFSDFNRISGKSYERATILIGKEMKEIKETLKIFSRDLINIFDKNKEIVESSKLVSFIQLKLILFEKIENELKHIDKEITSLSSEINEKESESRKISVKIEEAKKSPEYMEKQKSLQKINLLKNEIEKDILDLRQLIDFKALGNFYHIFEDKMQIVKAHRDDFQANFQKDNGKCIISLLETARLNSKEISEQLSQIHKKKEEIIQLETLLEKDKDKDKTNELYSNSTKAILEIGDLKDKKSRKEKRLEKLKTDKEKIISELKENLQKFKIELSE